MLMKGLISDSISSNFITTHLNILISTIKIKWNHIFYMWRNWQMGRLLWEWNVPMPMQEGRLFAQGWSLSVHNLTVGSVFWSWTPPSSWCLGLGRNNCLLSILWIETKQAKDPDINHKIIEISKGTCFSMRWKIINGLSTHSQPPE